MAERSPVPRRSPSDESQTLHMFALCGGGKVQRRSGALNLSTLAANVSATLSKKMLSALR